MKVLEIDVSGLEERGVVADIPEDMQADIIYNNHDGFMYISFLDGLGNVLAGYQKMVPNTDFLTNVRLETDIQIRCIKVNDFAEEVDKITIENFNKDYKLFMIGEEGEELETLEADTADIVTGKQIGRAHV